MIVPHDIQLQPFTVVDENRKVYQVEKGPDNVLFATEAFDRTLLSATSSSYHWHDDLSIDANADQEHHNHLERQVAELQDQLHTSYRSMDVQLAGTNEYLKKIRALQAICDEKDREYEALHAQFQLKSEQLLDCQAARKADRVKNEEDKATLVYQKNEEIARYSQKVSQLMEQLRQDHERHSSLLMDFRHNNTDPHHTLEKDRHLVALKEKVHSLTVELEDKETRINNLYITNAKLVQENSILSIQVKELEHDLRLSTAQCSTLTKDLERQSFRIQDLSSQLQSCRVGATQQVLDAQNSQGTLQMRLEVILEELETLHTAKLNVTTDNETLRQTVKMQQARIKELEDQLKASTSDVGQRLAEHQKTLDAMMSAHMGEVERLHSQIEAKQMECEKYSANLQTLQCEFEAMKDMLQLVQSEREKEGQQWEKERGALKAELEEQLSCWAEDAKGAQYASQELRQLKEERDDLLQTINMLESTLAAQEETTLKRCTAAAAMAKQQVDQAMLELRSAEDQVRQLKERLRAVEAERDVRQQSYEEAVLEMEVLRQSMRGMQAEQLAERHKVAEGSTELHQRNCQLELELQRVQSTARDLEGGLRRQLESLQSECAAWERRCKELERSVEKCHRESNEMELKATEVYRKTMADLEASHAHQRKMLEDRIEDALKQQSSASQSVAELQQKLRTAENAQNQTEQQLQQLKVTSEQQLVFHRKTIADLEESHGRQRKALEDRIEDMLKQQKLASQSVAELQQRVKAAESVQQQAEQREQQLKASSERQLESLRVQCAEWEMQCKETNSRMEQCRKGFAEAERANEVHKKAITDLEMAHAHQRKMLEDRIEDTLKQQKSMSQSATEQVRAAENAQRQAKQQLQQLKLSSEHQLESLQSQCTNWKTRCKEAESRAEQYRKDFAEAELHANEVHKKAIADLQAAHAHQCKVLEDRIEDTLKQQKSTSQSAAELQQRVRAAEHAQQQAEQQLLQWKVSSDRQLEEAKAQERSTLVNLATLEQRLQNLLSETSSRISTEQQTIAKLESSLKTADNTIQSITQQRDLLQRQLEEAQLMISKMEQKMKALQQELASQKDEAMRSRSEIQQLQLRLDRYTTTEVTVRTSVTALEGQLQEARRMNNSVQQELQNMMTQYEAVKSLRMEDQRQNEATLLAERQKWKAEHWRLEQEKDALKTQLDAQHAAHLLELERCKATSDAQVMDLQGCNAVLQQEIATLKGACQAKDCTLEQLRLAEETHAKKSEALQRQLDEWMAKERQWVSARKELQDKLAVASAAHHTAIAGWEVRYRNLEQCLQEAKAEAQESKRTIKMSTTQLEAETRTLQTELSASQERLTRQLKLTQEALNERDTLKIALKNAESEVLRLRADKESAVRASRELEAARADCDALREHLQRTTEDAKVENDNMCRVLKKAESQVTQLSTERSAHIKQIAELESELHTLRHQLDLLQQEKRTKETELKETIRKLEQSHIMETSIKVEAATAELHAELSAIRREKVDALNDSMREVARYDVERMEIQAALTKSQAEAEGLRKELADHQTELLLLLRELPKADTTEGTPNGPGMSLWCITNDLRQGIKRLTTQRDRSERALASQRSEWQVEKAELQSIRWDLEENLRTAQRVLAEMTTKQQETQSALALCKTEVTSLERRYAELAALRISKTSADHSHLESEVTALHAKLAEVQERSSKREAEWQRLMDHLGTKGQSGKSDAAGVEVERNQLWAFLTTLLDQLRDLLQGSTQGRKLLDLKASSDQLLVNGRAGHSLHVLQPIFSRYLAVISAILKSLEADNTTQYAMPRYSCCDGVDHKMVPLYTIADRSPAMSPSPVTVRAHPIVKR